MMRNLLTCLALFAVQVYGFQPSYGTRRLPYVGIVASRKVSSNTASTTALGATIPTTNGAYVPQNMTTPVGVVTAKVTVEHGRGAWKDYGDLDNLTPGKYQIKCFNKISPKGLERLEQSKYDVRLDGQDGSNAHAILLRSHKLQESDVPVTCRAIARAGAGVNNINVERMTELGIPVFNTPGANANAVKEIVFCGMFLASRGILQGVQHVKKLIQDDSLDKNQIAPRIEKDKAQFKGREIKGKTLAVIGLGNIGAIVAQDAADGLGMKIVGYDPYLSVENAMKLPRDIKLVDNVKAAVVDADYISIHVPYSKNTHGVISREIIQAFKPDAVLLNFARGELVDSDAMLDFLNQGEGGMYVSDFYDETLCHHENMMIMPHLGASTAEAEDEAAAMAVETLRDYLESGTIRQNCINFPSLVLGHRQENTVRFTIISQDSPGILGHIFDVFGSANLNIVQEVARTRGSISYTVLDVDTTTHSEIEFKQVQEQITMLPGVLSSRVIYGKPGSGYAKNIEGEYFV